VTTTLRLVAAIAATILLAGCGAGRPPAEEAAAPEPPPASVPTPSPTASTAAPATSAPPAEPSPDDEDGEVTVDAPTGVTVEFPGPGEVVAEEQEGSRTYYTDVLDGGAYFALQVSEAEEIDAAPEIQLMAVAELLTNQDGAVVESQTPTSVGGHPALDIQHSYDGEAGRVLAITRLVQADGYRVKLFALGSVEGAEFLRAFQEPMFASLVVP
jgi:hypothetical protein